MEIWTVKKIEAKFFKILFCIYCVNENGTLIKFLTKYINFLLLNLGMNSKILILVLTFPAVQACTFILILFSCFINHYFFKMSSSNTRRCLFLAIRDCFPKVLIKYTVEFHDTIKTTLMDLLDISTVSEDQEKFIRDFHRHVPQYYKEANRNAKSMLKRREIYFSKPIPVLSTEPDVLPEPEDMDLEVEQDSSPRSYGSKSSSQKYRDVAKLIAENEGDKILDAAIKVLKDQGHLDASWVVAQLKANPDLGTHLRKLSAQPEPEKISPERYFVCKVSSSTVEIFSCSKIGFQESVLFLKKRLNI